MKFWLWAVLKKFWEANSKIRLLEVLCNLVVSVCAKFEECAAKTVRGVGFLTKAYFSLPPCCQFLAHGFLAQNWDIDLKFKMGGRIDTILMCVKVGDDRISSLENLENFSIQSILIFIWKLKVVKIKKDPSRIRCNEIYPQDFRNGECV